MATELIPTETRLDSLTRFETIADLYYLRFRRLAPGKSEPMASYRSSSDEENRAQFSAWITGGQAFEDAIARVAVLKDESERIRARAADQEHTHRCRKCRFDYTPQDDENGDCPACGHDGREPGDE